MGEYEWGVRMVPTKYDSYMCTIRTYDSYSAIWNKSNARFVQENTIRAGEYDSYMENEEYDSYSRVRFVHSEEEFLGFVQFRDSANLDFF